MLSPQSSLILSPSKGGNKSQLLSNLLSQLINLGRHYCDADADADVHADAGADADADADHADADANADLLIEAFS